MFNYVLVVFQEYQVQFKFELVKGYERLKVDVRCYIVYYILYLILLYLTISYTILFSSSPILSFPFLSPLPILSSSNTLLLLNPLIHHPFSPLPFLSIILSLYNLIHLSVNSKYTCRHLDTLIYIIIQQSDPACFIGVDG